MSVRNALRKVIPLRASTFEKARKRLEASNVATAEKICLLEAKSAEIATKLDHLDATFDERVTSMVTQEATSALVAAKLGSVPKVGVSIRFWRAGEACPRKTDIV